MNGGMLQRAAATTTSLAAADKHRHSSMTIFLSCLPHCSNLNHIFQTHGFMVSRHSSMTIFLSCLPHCSNLNHIFQTHGFMVSTGLDQDNFLLSKFIDSCSSIGFSSYAFSVFIHIPRPDVFLYNTIIKSLSLSSPKHSVILYNQIQSAGNSRPDAYSVPFALKAVARLSAINVGRQIHCQAIGIGLNSFVPVVTGFIHMYASCGCLSDARKLFDVVHSKSNDVSLWNAMVSAYAKVGEVDNARLLFDHMPHRNVISWTALVSGYTQASRPNDAINIFQKMLLEDVVEPDEVTMLTALSACADMGALALGEGILQYIHKIGLYQTVPINNALIDLYAKSGNIKKALQVFENMKHKSIITWTTMIAGLALHGLGREALDMFSRMERTRSKPNEITFIAVLSACSHVGFVQMGRWYFNYMWSRYRIEPQIEHYGCMIDLVARAGFLHDAQELVNKMPFEANSTIWGSLLAASRIHGDAEVAECALQHLIELEPCNSGNYMLLSNIYASLGRWNKAGIIRKGMKDTGIKKMPGRSFIELNNKVHEFIAGDSSHPQFKTIYEVLCKINEQWKMAGYV